ncbi:hypothetical protein [Stenotrophomonas muris]|uniref:hypothetical protein n=1 Tax=Stenotrophomonas muris TaxID=2963283 RepID=UPI0021C92BC9|nr:hypothetical protein [Stenotrophomonas muris]MCU1180713.1 hypothetical protein [Stenotrophomonas maltophilia]
MSGISGQLTPKRELEDVIGHIHAYAMNGKHKNVVAANISWLIDRCSEYRNDFQFAKLRLNKPKKLSTDEAANLQRLYKAAAFEGQLEVSKTGSLVACPLCGIRQGVTIDHYLPQDKALFPHFSYFSYNLIPACSNCQGCKGAAYPSRQIRYPLFLKSDRKIRQHARRSLSRKMGRKFRIQNYQRLIHPYFDTSIDPMNVALKFDFDNIAGPHSFQLVYGGRALTPAARLFQNHVRRLNIRARIQPVARHCWEALKRTLRATPGPYSHSAVRAHIDLLYHHYRELDGSGAISTMLYKAISLSAPCVDMLVVGLTTPPPTPSTTR